MVEMTGVTQFSQHPASMSRGWMTMESGWTCYTECADYGWV